MREKRKNKSYPNKHLVTTQNRSKYKKKKGLGKIFVLPRTDMDPKSVLENILLGERQLFKRI
jgi:hypothetical protein